MKKRVLAILMSIALAIGMIPSAFAEGSTPPGSDTGSTVTNGSYNNDGEWVAGGDGTTTVTIDGTDVKLSKTAQPVAGQPNTFDITLKVETTQSTVTQTGSGAVVLVIDVSGSMAFCAECGGEDWHYDTCKFYNRDWWNNRVTSAQSRIVAARNAAKDFLASYAGDDASANRELAIVTFSTNYTTTLNWVNVAGGKDKNSYNAAVSAIDRLSAGGGTNLEGGLYTALNNLKSTTVSGISAKNVVLLTDGVPTYRIDGGNGSDGSAKNNQAAANQATAIKNTGASLYTVCFGVAKEATYGGGPTVGDFLRDSIASPAANGKTYAYNADNTDELNKAFTAITESITSGLDGQGLQVTDPMGKMIIGPASTELFPSSDGKTYTWTLANAQTSTKDGVTTYTYTYTYRVTLDVQAKGFEENTFYPTNGPTYLTVNDNKYYFPVPGVKGELPRTSVSVTKAWSDNNNQDGKRTTSVQVQLYKDDVEFGTPVTLNAGNNWSHTWTGLIAKSGGEDHVYTVDEVKVPSGYDSEVTGTAETGFTITNTHEIEKTSVSGSKTWNDNNNQDGKRPASITINLLANGTKVDSKIVTAADQWSWSFTNLDKYANGQEITYTITEEAVADYTTEVKGFDVINTHAPETTDISVSKVWNDNGDQDGKRPNDITVVLLADGEKVGSQVLNAGNNWAATFEDLPVYAAGAVGEKIAYTVQEAEVPAGYNAEVTTVENGFEITNSHTPETTIIYGTKTWDDAGNQDGIRPDSVTIRLYADGEEIASAAVSEQTQWTYSFTDLPVYNNGKEIVYTITEDAVEGYTPIFDEDSFDLTNTHTPYKTSVAVSKSWDDSDNQDGIRPDSITVKLLANGQATGKTLVLTAKDGWTGTFTDLDEYAEGQKIVYTVEEVSVEGYTSSVSGDAVKGFTITNSHAAEVIAISGAKTWDDGDNQDGKRPDTITVNLLANGVEVAEVKVSAASQWTYTFENMPKYEDGEEITYTIVEDAVEGYTATVNGYDLVNSYTPGKVSFPVTKTWSDSNNKDGIRPDSVTVKLLADGKDTGLTLTLTAEGKWTGSFTALDEYADGQKIVYTVEEVAVKGYNPVITGDAASGFVITNSHNITPQTGDNSMPILMTGIAAAALCLLVVLAKAKRKEEN